MFCLCAFLVYVRWMVDREVDGPMWAVLGRSWGLCGRPWAALRATVGGLGLLLGPLRAVLGRSWGLCGLSWAALGTYVGGLGSLLGPMLTVLGCLKTKSSPNPSGKAIWQADLAGKVAQTEARRPCRGGDGNPMFSGPEASVDMHTLMYIHMCTQTHLYGRNG